MGSGCRPIIIVIILDSHVVIRIRDLMLRWQVSRLVINEYKFRLGSSQGQRSRKRSRLGLRKQHILHLIRIWTQWNDSQQNIFNKNILYSLTLSDHSHWSCILLAYIDLLLRYNVANASTQTVQCAMMSFSLFGGNLFRSGNKKDE